MTTNLIPQSAVVVCNGAVRTTSLEVAKAFEKEHRNVCRDIEQIMVQVVGNSEMLKIERFETTYKNNLGKDVKQRAYSLDKNAFMLLVMGFTGKKAMQIKIGFIKLFDLMEAKLRELQGTPVQPETPLPATQRPAFVPEAHYYGVPIISLQKLAELIGTDPANIHNDIARPGITLANDIDIFHIKSRRQLAAGGIPRSFHPEANNINLFSKSGFEKIVAFRCFLPATSSGHSMTSAAPAIVRTKPEPVHPLGLKLADKKNTMERVTISAEKMYDLIARGKDPLSAILRKLFQAGYDVREEMAEFAYLNQCFFREEMLRMELWAIFKNASNKVTNTIPRNLTMTYWFNGDRIVDQQRA